MIGSWIGILTSMQPVMQLGAVTLFPEMFSAVSEYGITGRAIKSGLVDLRCWNPRDFTTNQHRTVDDRPYGGGPGMVMMAEPLAAALSVARKELSGASVIHLSPEGRRLDHQGVQELAGREKLIFLAGRYEGIDERLLEDEVDEEWSIGDYVISGGELAAMVVIDSVIRLLPGALGDEASAEQDAFVDGLLDCGHFTRPELYKDKAVPKVLLSGDHEAIRKWRLKQSLGRTWLKRPDLLDKRILNDEEQVLLKEFQQEENQGRS